MCGCVDGAVCGCRGNQVPLPFVQRVLLSCSITKENCEEVLEKGREIKTEAKVKNDKMISQVHACQYLFLYFQGNKVS